MHTSSPASPTTRRPFSSKTSTAIPSPAHWISPRWTGAVGFVTEALQRIDVDPARTTALLCGPEPMMRFCARALMSRGVPAEAIQLSLERNMQCGTGQCGHCQLGELLLCRDGPVVDYTVAEPLLRVPEL